jgi:hypothetical protein
VRLSTVVCDDHGHRVLAASGRRTGVSDRGMATALARAALDLPYTEIGATP